MSLIGGKYQDRRRILIRCSSDRTTGQPNPLVDTKSLAWLRRVSGDNLMGDAQARAMVGRQWDAIGFLECVCALGSAHGAERIQTHEPASGSNIGVLAARRCDIPERLAAETLGPS